MPDPMMMAALTDAQTVELALLVGLFTAITAPLLLTWLIGRQHTKDKAQDYKRQDAVRDALVKSNAAAQAAAEKAQAVLQAVSDGVERVHKLVNSDKTAAMEREKKLLAIQLAQAREINRLQGGNPSPESLALIDQIENQIDNLTVELADRHRQGELAEAEMNAKLAIATATAAQVALQAGLALEGKPLP
jgi:hypothetical protein